MEIMGGIGPRRGGDDDGLGAAAWNPTEVRYGTVWFGSRRRERASPCLLVEVEPIRSIRSSSNINVLNGVHSTVHFK